EWRTIEIAVDLRPFGDYANGVPRAETRFRHPRGRDRAALSVHDGVEPKVVLERVGADQKVVATVPRSKDDAPAGVLFPGDRSEAHRDVDIGKLLVLEQSDCPRLCLGGLGEDLAP